MTASLVRLCKEIVLQVASQLTIKEKYHRQPTVTTCSGFQSADGAALKAWSIVAAGAESAGELSLPRGAWRFRVVSQWARPQPKSCG